MPLTAAQKSALSAQVSVALAHINALAVDDGVVTPPPPTGPYPAWRNGKAVGTFFEIPGTANMSGYQWPAPNPQSTAQIIDSWNGLARLGSTWWSSGAGGHGNWQNASIKLDLGVDVPAWAMAHPGSPYSAVNATQPYYGDGLPVSNHTYWTSQGVHAANAKDGIERVMRFSDYATYGTGTAGNYTSGPKVNGFRTAGQWEPAGFFPDALGSAPLVSVAKDPRNDNVYLSQSNAVTKWTAKTGVWSWLASYTATQPVYPNAGFMEAWENYPSLVDSVRDRLVGLTSRNSSPQAPHLQCVALTNPIITRLDLTSAPGNLAESYPGFVHDLDGDRYLVMRGNGELWSIHPVTGACALVTTTTPPVNGTYSRLEYFPALGGVAYLPRFSSNVLFLSTR